MGILGLIQRTKDKFKGREYSKEEIDEYRGRAMRGDIEVYDNKKKTVGEMIQGAKDKFKVIATKHYQNQEMKRETENKVLKSKITNLKLKNQYAKQKEKLQKKTGRGLRAVFGGVNIPTAQQKPNERGMAMGGNPFPGSSSEAPRTPTKKNIVRQEEGRNELGGRDPFG